MTSKPLLLATALFCGTALAGPATPSTSTRVTGNTKAPGPMVQAAEVEASPAQRAAPVPEAGPSASTEVEAQPVEQRCCVIGNTKGPGTMTGPLSAVAPAPAAK